MDALATMEPASMQQAMSLAATLAKSGLIPRALQNKPGDVLVVLLTGRELGLGPMQSLRGIHVVDGKAVLAADLIVGLCVRETRVCQWFRMVESTDAVATYEAMRVGSPKPVTMSFTIEQAKAAGLTGKQNWRNYPAAMLRARCAAALARTVFADLCAGVYDPDELEHPAAKPAPVPMEAEQVAALGRDVMRGESPALPAPSPVVEAVLQQVEAVPATSGRIEHRTEVERVTRAIGGTVESVKVPAAVAFGPHKGAPIDATLTDAALTETIDLAHQKLDDDPKAKWARAMRENLTLLEAELDRRIDRSKAGLASAAMSQGMEPGATG